MTKLKKQAIRTLLHIGAAQSKPILKWGSQVALQQGQYTSNSFNVFTINHEVDINHMEMELAFPFQRALEVLSRLKKHFEETQRFPIFPINLRVTKADEW